MQDREQSYWREAGGAHREPRDLLEQMLSRPAGAEGGFDLEGAVERRPLVAFGAALAAGFALGRFGDELPGQTSGAWRTPVDRELELLKGAALAVLGAMARDNLSALVPGETGAALTGILERRLRASGISTGAQGSGPYGAERRTGESQQTSTAPGASFAASGRQAEYTTPPAQGGSQSIDNTRVRDSEHIDPYYPPGGPGRPIAGGATPGSERASDAHELREREPEVPRDKDDLNWR